LLQAALKTTDQAERTKDYQQAQKIVIDEAAYVYLLPAGDEQRGERLHLNPMLEQVFNIDTMSK
jgi:peptide/nickel transport system substrate-binding protein